MTRCILTGFSIPVFLRSTLFVLPEGGCRKDGQDDAILSGRKCFRKSLFDKRSSLPKQAIQTIISTQRNRLYCSMLSVKRSKTHQSCLVHFKVFYGDVFEGNLFEKAIALLGNLGGLKYLLFPDKLADQVQIITVQTNFVRVNIK